MKTIYNILSLILVYYCTIIDSKGQLSISNFNNVNDIMTYFIGPGINISNAQFNGDMTQVGKFTNGISSGLGIDEGIAITTGKATYAGNLQFGLCYSGAGDNGYSSPVNNGLFDVDLQSICGGGGQCITISPASLEFDFISSGNSIEFEYVFASEEYPDYVGTQYNDACGIFLSGPSISGQYSNNSINIATLPNGIPVSINNVNDSYYSQYYVSNCVGNPGQPVYNLVYDGFTVVLTATYSLVCGEQYHLKIAISNIDDNLMDSGLFLKKGSLTSNFSVGPITEYPNPVCEGQPLNLSVQGDPSYYYSWSTGDAGTGLTSITTIANLSIISYSVTVTNPATDCVIISNSSDIIVHTNHNQSPYINGINNTAEYTYYAYPGQQFCFDIPSFDSPNENVAMTLNSSIPSGATWTNNNANHQTGTFCWTPAYSDIGIHSFIIEVIDNNKCNSLHNYYTFFINVICGTCPMDIYYENRTPSNNPIPSVTIAARSIFAGKNVDPNQINGPVETGNQNVLFQAGESIFLEDGFLAGSGFIALIDPATCTQTCDCCENWSGFTFDFIPNVIGGGYGDIWYVPDSHHPFCAFNAMGFDLLIEDRWGNTVYTLSNNSTQCCAYRAPGVNNPISYSSIYWNGRTNAGQIVDDGVYYYILNLYGCNNHAIYNGSIQKLPLKAGDKIINNDTTQKKQITSAAIIKTITQLYPPRTTINKIQNADITSIPIKVFPNPSSDIFYIQVSETLASEGFIIEVYDTKGEKIMNASKTGYFNSIDLSLFTKSIYLLKISYNNEYYKFKLVKQ